MDHTYWKKQTSSRPLFPDIEWSKPEQRSHAGRLGIIGGNKLSFAAIAEGYSQALNDGSGIVKVLLPDILKKSIPTVMNDVIFAPTNPSGSLSREALNDMNALGEWATMILLLGDAGRSSETAITYEDFLRAYTGPMVATRDAIDLLKNSAISMVERPDTVLVASFAQIQKIFQSVYYPKMLVFSMNLTQLVEALHKFTITYPVTIVVLHKEHLVVAHSGDITTTEWTEPMRIWRGQTATRAATYWGWNTSQPLESITASFLPSS